MVNPIVTFETSAEIHIYNSLRLKYLKTGITDEQIAKLVIEVGNYNKCIEVIDSFLNKEYETLEEATENLFDYA